MLAFAATTQAMAMEKMCHDENINGRLIPLPPDIDAGCGLAWRMEPEEYALRKEKIINFPQGIESVTELELYS